jgi:hypothetical protein
MSSMLEEIERQAGQRVITDTAQIGEVIDNYLSQSFGSTISNKRENSRNLWFLRNELSNGFDRTIEELNEYAYGDILALIWSERGHGDLGRADYFKVPEENGELALKTNWSAGHCYFLAIDYMNRSVNKNLKRLGMIDFTSFIDYLKSSIEDAKHQSDIEDIEEQIWDYYCRMYKKEYPDRFEPVSFTLGEYIELAIKRARKEWFCFMQPISYFAQNVTEAYIAINYLFIDCITYLLVADNDKYVKWMPYKPLEDIRYMFPDVFGSDT